MSKVVSSLSFKLALKTEVWTDRLVQKQVGTCRHVHAPLEVCSDMHSPPHIPHSSLPCLPRVRQGHAALVSGLGRGSGQSSSGSRGLSLATGAARLVP